MLRRLLPRWPGQAAPIRRSALILLGLLAVVKAAMGLNCIVNGLEVATQADGIPLDTFPPAAARTALAFFALWGLGQVVLALLGLLALARWRALTPLVFALYLFEHAARKGILLFLPPERTGDAPGFWINAVLLAATAAGLALALWPSARSQPE
jgi:hypothetical protein